MNDNIENYRMNLRKERYLRREQRQAMHGPRGWMSGILLILLGLGLLAQDFQMISLNNWWALFIMLPALGSFGTAWRMVQSADGHFTKDARSAIIVGIVLTSVTAMLLFDMKWTILGPALLILGGTGFLVNAIIPE